MLHFQEQNSQITIKEQNCLPYGTALYEVIYQNKFLNIYVGHRRRYT